MRLVMTLPTAIAGALALALVLGASGCGKPAATVQASSATQAGEAPSDVQAGAASDLAPSSGPAPAAP